MMVYGVVECINAIKIYRLRKAWEKLLQQQQPQSQIEVKEEEES